MKRQQAPPMRVARRQPSRKQYEDFAATELFCPRCRAAMPVRRRLLLVLPSGDKYDYVCTRCGESVGSQVTSDPNRQGIVIP